MVYRALVAADDATLDATFAALSHRARRSVLRQVLDADAPLAMSDLAASTGMSPQLLNKHAAALERAGLISRVPNGRERHVYAHAETLASARQWIDEMSQYWNAQLDSLEQYVADLPSDERPEPKEH